MIIWTKFQSFKVSKFQSFKVFILVNLFLFGCGEGDRKKGGKDKKPGEKPNEFEIFAPQTAPEPAIKEAEDNCKRCSNVMFRQMLDNKNNRQARELYYFVSQLTQNEQVLEKLESVCTISLPPIKEILDDVSEMTTQNYDTSLSSSLFCKVNNYINHIKHFDEFWKEVKNDDELQELHGQAMQWQRSKQKSVEEIQTKILAPLLQKFLDLFAEEMNKMVKAQEFRYTIHPDSMKEAHRGAIDKIQYVEKELDKLKPFAAPSKKTVSHLNTEAYLNALKNFKNYTLKFFLNKFLAQRIARHKDICEIKRYPRNAAPYTGELALNKNEPITLEAGENKVFVDNVRKYFPETTDDAIKAVIQHCPAHSIWTDYFSQIKVLPYVQDSDLDSLFQKLDDLPNVLNQILNEDADTFISKNVDEFFHKTYEKDGTNYGTSIFDNILRCFDFIAFFRS